VGKGEIGTRAQVEDVLRPARYQPTGKSIDTANLFEFKHEEDV
jgi:hypothetical protein